MAWGGRLAALIAVFLAAAIAGRAIAQSEDLAALNARIEELYRARQYSEALPLAESALALAGKLHGAEDDAVMAPLVHLVNLYNALRRYRDTEPLLRRLLPLREARLGPDHLDLCKVLRELAVSLEIQGRYAEAEPLRQRVLNITENALGGDHLDVAWALNALGNVHAHLGNFIDTELIQKRSLLITEKALGPEHPHVATSLHLLGLLYLDLLRYKEAVPILRRALAIREKALPDSGELSISLSLLGSALSNQGRTSEALSLHERSLAIMEKSWGPKHPSVSGSLNNVANILVEQRRYAEAERLYRRGLAILEESHGSNNYFMSSTYNALARMYQRQGRIEDSEALIRHSLSLQRRSVGMEHSDVIATLSQLGYLLLSQSRWEEAGEVFESGAGVLIKRSQRSESVLGRAMTGKTNSDAVRSGAVLAGLIRAWARAPSAEKHANASFVSLQWAQSSEAAASLSQMAVRSAKADPSLSRLVRERQDLVEEWQKRDQARSATVSQAPDKRDRAGEAANLDQLAAVDTRIGEIDRGLSADFPDYAALARPQPLSIDEVQAELRTDEALVLFLDTSEWQQTPEETFIWVVTKTDVRWVRSELGTSALTREVAALRCGLDAAAWEDEGAARCSGLLKLAPDKTPKGSEPLPFDVARAHALYKALFGQAESLIGNKHLLIVPSGPLTQLPFNVLVTEDAGPATSNIDYRKTEWLARKHAVTVLPSVSSLKALRRVAKPSAATKPMVGFGNPLLSGPDQRYARLAKAALEKQQCAKPVVPQVAARVGARVGVRAVAQRRGLADLADIRMQVPLPETADELCTVAQALLVTDSDILLGTRATERQIKSLSQSGSLAAYRIVHFATHGVLAGQVTPGVEPGLILTPPERATDEDDGYLSASEVAALKLDADWVILSACNTAAGGAEGAEALSGLARAFFYAGARALLVSHWAVNSAATVKLITSAVGSISRDKSLGRSEALRRAMLAMIDTGDPREAHPNLWAAFVVVGEGAAVK